MASISKCIVQFQLPSRNCEHIALMKLSQSMVLSEKVFDLNQAWMM